MSNKFCKWQSKCKEDNVETWSCSAHIHEDRVFQCPYNNFKDSQKRQFPCMDAEDIKESPNEK